MSPPLFQYTLTWDNTTWAGDYDGVWSMKPGKLCCYSDNFIQQETGCCQNYQNNQIWIKEKHVLILNLSDVILKLWVDGEVLHWTLAEQWWLKYKLLAGHDIVTLVTRWPLDLDLVPGVNSVTTHQSHHTQLLVQVCLYHYHHLCQMMSAHIQSEPVVIN